MDDMERLTAWVDHRRWCGYCHVYRPMCPAGKLLENAHWQAQRAAVAWLEEEARRFFAARLSQGIANPASLCYRSSLGFLVHGPGCACPV